MESSLLIKTVCIVSSTWINASHRENLTKWMSSCQNMINWNKMVSFFDSGVKECYTLHAKYMVIWSDVWSNWLHGQFWAVQICIFKVLAHNPDRLEMWLILTICSAGCVLQKQKKIISIKIVFNSLLRAQTLDSLLPTITMQLYFIPSGRSGRDWKLAP